MILNLQTYLHVTLMVYNITNKVLIYIYKYKIPARLIGGNRSGIAPAVVLLQRPMKSGPIALLLRRTQRHTATTYSTVCVCPDARDF